MSKTIYKFKNIPGMKSGFTFSPHGVSSIDAYKLINSAFIDFCMNHFNHGTFSSYCDGEPVFLSSGFEFSRRQFDRLDKEQKLNNDTENGED